MNPEHWFLHLKVLSNEMDLTEIRLIKERGAEGFRKIRPHLILWEPFKVLERLLVFKLPIVQQLDSCGEYSLRTWIKKLRRFVNTIAQF